MYYETIKITDVRAAATEQPSLSMDLATSKRSRPNMKRAVRNLRRLSAEAAGIDKTGPAIPGAKLFARRLVEMSFVLGIAATIFPTDATARSPIACGTVYTIERGDTLFKIAERAFGNGKLYKQIFEVNREVLPDSASVEIGNAILIPCLDGAGQLMREEAIAQEPIDQFDAPEAAPLQVAAAPAPVVTLVATSGPFMQAAKKVLMASMPIQSIAGPINPAASPASMTEGTIGATEIAASAPEVNTSRMRLLAGSDLARFSDETLPRGGLITDLVSRAIDAVSPGQSSVTFVNDWGAHLKYLLPEGDFDVSFPWYKPDCSNLDRLNAELQSLCTEFEFSNPILEVRVGFYTRSGEALAETRSLATLSHKRLCRPKGQFTFDLEQSGLVASNVTVETQFSAQQCFTRLVNGQADVVTLVKSDVDYQLRQLGITGAVTEIVGLESVQTLHALVSKQNPDRQVHLDLLNRGLADVMSSGKWFEVVASHQGRQLALMN